MDAVFRVSEEVKGAKSPAVKAPVTALLILLLSACSSFQTQLPGGTGSISGTVLSDDYTLEIAALGEEQAASLEAGQDARSFGSPAAALAGDPSGNEVLRGPPVPEIDLVRSGDVLGDAVLRDAASANGQAVLRPHLPQAAHVPGQVLVQFRARAAGPAALSSPGQRQRPELVEPGPGEDVSQAVARFRRDPDVLTASPNYYIYPAALPDDPFLPQQWSLPAAGLPVTWSEPGGELVTVAVVDSGFDLDHIDLRGVFLPGYDFCGNSDCSTSDADPGASLDSNWHGTHVAGIIAALGNNGEGVKGVASAVRVLPVKVFNEAGSGGNVEVLIRALRWAAGLPVEGAPVNPNPARIINLSLAGDFPSEVLQPTLDAVRAAGAVVVAATGNAGLDRVMSPAAAAGVIGVGAMNSAFERSCFSNYGVGKNGPGGVDVLAPGGEADGSMVGCGVGPYETEGLMSTIPGDGYGSALGTSMAAPMVSGVAALILGRDPTLGVSDLELRLVSSAYFDSSYMVESQYGAGILRADSALGFTGPGDRVSVELTAVDSGAMRRLPLTLGLSASGVGFSFEGIESGRYELRAKDPQSGALFTSREVTLTPGEQLRTDLILRSGS